MMVRKKSFLVLIVIGSFLLILVWFFWPFSSGENFQQKCQLIVPGMEADVADDIMVVYHKKISPGDDENIIYFKSKQWFDFEACSVNMKDGKVVDVEYIFD